MWVLRKAALKMKMDFKELIDSLLDINKIPREGPVPSLNRGIDQKWFHSSETGFWYTEKREFTNHLTVHKPFFILFSRSNPHTRLLSQSGPVHKGCSPTVQVTTGNLTDIAHSLQRT
jgi:hypothetical protein